eukprot:12684369-Alexandrium_andersonii.AAC.1
MPTRSGRRHGRRRKPPVGIGPGRAHGPPRRTCSQANLLVGGRRVLLQRARKALIDRGSPVVSATG